MIGDFAHLSITQEGTSVHFSNVRFSKLFMISLHCLTLLGARDSPLSFTCCRINREDGGGGKKAWKGGVRRLRPKFWQRTKCTFENNATLYRTEKYCRPQNRPKIGEKVTKNRNLALFRLFFVTFKMIVKWGSVGGQRVLNS